MATQSGTGVSGPTNNGAKTVTNPFGTQVSGSVNGIQISPAGTVTNGGGITGLKGSGVLINGSGTVNDLDGATITGGMNGVKITGAGTVNNAGSITGTQGFGTYIGGAGTVNNTGIIDNNCLHLIHRHGDQKRRSKHKKESILPISPDCFYCC